MIRNKMFKTLLILIAIIFVLAISIKLFFDNQPSYFDKGKNLYYKNKEIYIDVSNVIFKLYDTGQIKTGESLDKRELDELSNLKVESIGVNKLKNELKQLFDTNFVSEIMLVDSNVIFIKYGAFFQTASGIAITRNDGKLLDNYKETSYDTNTLEYEKLESNVFYYTAGL